MSWADRAKEVLQRGEKTVIYSKFDSIQDKDRIWRCCSFKTSKKEIPKSKRLSSCKYPR